MWIVFGFLALGFLVGNLIGLTADSVVTPVLGLLFTFGGGSIIAFIGKFGQADRRLAGQAILALSAACLFGVYSSIAISEWQLLSPPGNSQTEVAGSTARLSIEDKKYLRSAVIEPAHGIDTQLAMGDISADEAYKQLFKLIMKSERETVQE